MPASPTSLELIAELFIHMIQVLLHIFILILIIVQLTLTTWIICLFILAVLSIRSRKQPIGFDRDDKHRFAVIIPAHNEEKMIGRTLDSIINSEYDPELMEVFVVADNCNDRTASLAIDAGTQCITRCDTENCGKGYALQAGIEAVQKHDEIYDAYVFCDADTLVAPDFFRRMSQALSAGHQVIQGHYCVSEPDRTWFTRLTHLGFVLKNYFQYPGLNRLGLSMPLRGSGMCISSDIINKFGWQSTSLTEDLDFSITLLDEGIKIYFNFWAENRQYMPPTLRAARVQRARWSAGESQALYHRLCKYLIRGALKLDWRLFFQGLILAAPPMSLLLLLSVGVLVALFHGLGGWRADSLWALAPALITTLAYTGYFLMGLSVTGASRRYVAAITMIPVYAVWRVSIHFVSALPGRAQKKKWQRTERS